MSEYSFSTSDLPQHIAVIMDGNGRWAKKQGKPRVYGHKMAVTAVRDTITTVSRLQIPAITLFAFSQENWKRPQEEVSVLMDLFMTVLTKEIKKLHSHNLRLRVIGDVSRFSTKLQKKIIEAEKKTKENTGTCINIAANYGGKWDIIEATKVLARQVEQGILSVGDITEDLLAEHLCLADLPEVDLMIRTSGEYRISNFMLWQIAYSELYFTDLYWPEFDEHQLLEAISWYISRERRFGCTSEQLHAFLEQSSPKGDA